MTPFYEDGWLTVFGGDCRVVMAEMEPESVHCVVTSPPYWGLRDYGDTGQLGLEATPEEYVANMVDVFRGVRRVLRSDGTVWLNLGDSYASHDPGGYRPGEFLNPEGRVSLKERELDTRSEISPDAPGAAPPARARNRAGNYRSGGLKPKDLVGIPWRVAFALQQPYYTGFIPDEKDRTWLAALVDGEGTFTILSTTSPHGSGNSYPPIAQVRMTSQGVVQKAASLVGVASPAQYPPSATGNRAVYQWRLSGRRAADVARELYPYLIEKRKQALIVWNHQAIRDSYETKRGVPIPPVAVEKQRACRDLIRRLNHGEHVDVPSWMVEPPSLLEPGWYLRSDVIWAKPNPMPESVTDRPTKSHEYLFLLSKSPRYYFDADAVREPHETLEHQQRYAGRYLGKHLPEHAAADNNNREWMVGPDGPNPGGRNLRSVWTIATQPYPGAHFATFPRKLVEPCIKAGTSERGVCPECGAPWVRVVERRDQGWDGSRYGERVVAASGGAKDGGTARSTLGSTNGKLVGISETTGWRPSCNHGVEPVPARVLDCFAGSGTTGVVAQALNRRAILIDLNPDYLAQALKRNRDIPLGLPVA